jgi:hypothetical protein
MLDLNTLWLPAAIWTLLLVFWGKFIVSSSLNLEQHTNLFFVSFHYGFYSVERKMVIGCGIKMWEIFTCVYYTILFHCYIPYYFIISLCYVVNWITWTSVLPQSCFGCSSQTTIKWRDGATQIFVFLWCNSLTRTRPSHCRGFEITHRHTTLDRTPLDQESARCRGLYLTT